jgi:hypothetical protein
MICTSDNFMATGCPFNRINNLRPLGNSWVFTVFLSLNLLSQYYHYKFSSIFIPLVLAFHNFTVDYQFVYADVMFFLQGPLKL